MALSPATRPIVLLVFIAAFGACSSVPKKVFHDRACVQALSELEKRERAHSGGGTPGNEGLTRDQVSAAITSGLHEFGNCYDAAPFAKGEKEGTLVFKFLVQNDGTVEKACAAESDFEDIEFRACVTNVLRKTKFPKPMGGAPVSVTYPFEFNGR